MQLFKHKLSLVNQVLRLFQIVGAVACVFYYGRIIAKADKDDTYHDSKWVRYCSNTIPSSLLTPC